MKYRKKGKTFENPCFDWLIKMNINVTDDVTNFYFYTKKHFHNNLSMKVKIEQKKQNSRYFFFFFFSEGFPGFLRKGQIIICCRSIRGVMREMWGKNFNGSSRQAMEKNEKKIQRKVKRKMEKKRKVKKNKENGKNEKK